jgi:capsular polysaccharide biosynthesis protein
MTSGIVEKENLQAFTDRIAQKFQAELMQRLKEATRSDPAGSVNPFKFLGILFGVLAALMVMLIALSRLRR